MEGRITVTVTAPVMVGTGHHGPGARVDVTMAEAAQLEAMGVIAPIAEGVSVTDLAPGAPGFDEAVASVAKALAETMVDAAIAASIAPLEAKKNAALARAVEAEAQRDLLLDRVLDLQAQLAAATPPQGETVEQETEEQPLETPKKVSAAKKKG